ncbi:hypothetical protein CC85DRAFT_284464 [Cutaneotrichosporon oleaginosum]|uniref:Glutamine amidotransferase type-2 domain-containing protein n=1 Tax=Cutaneotrichosporon oleaginosum TaxID=879819 RepID=A0A0J0XR04_9TREE|nr:uncharacterized protein CC85DRAFT_284464 [Cutaneotrichosporon oleaginosum]KLT43541.1 hypothetical protein CC85DRAFT_284464 [Cutaneotrichosporon oleaginosum]TXT05560.1 hypothetical protein COLE_06880 [Cutaneotrichosporon oleaginosum]
MCGITLTLGPPADIPLARSLHAANAARGPDTQGIYARRIGPDLLLLGASVLGLRGQVTAQPRVGRGVLAWNGQVFSGLEVDINDNDTACLFTALEAGHDPVKLLSTIEGPWAFVYVCGSTVTFGVDPLSRRSLLIHTPDDACQSFILSSTRSAMARERGIGMRALEGGEIGVLDLTSLNGATDWAGALTLSRPRVSVAAVNGELPVSPPERLLAVEAEVDSFLTHLTTSVRRRVENIPAPAPGAARAAVLFSGGVDCSLLVCLIHSVLPAGEPIELVNVAFAQPPKSSGKLTPKPSGGGYDVPDRLSGREAAAELRAAFDRDFRFVEVDVDVETSRAARQDVIDAMYPSATEMDLSLAYPLYFASLGRGRVDGTDYTVGAKVYFSGLGADEQLAGYTRHRKAYERGGWAALVSEIQLDLDRLPQRNLARDDRVLSAHARDARYPFLDLGFVRYVSQLPVWAKCNLELPAGEGDKALIRLAAARWLPKTARRVKRAMQFGTKSAKLYEGAPRGHKAGEQLITK